MVLAEELSRVKDVLAEALKLPGDDRIPCIQDAFPNEPKLWDELLAILDGYGDAAHANPGWTSGTTFDDLVPSLAPVPAAPIPITTSLLTFGAKYGPYRVVKILEPGGMGEVAVADDTRLPRQVVLKCLAGKWLASPLARQRLMREARTAAALSHPNIATLYDVLEEYEQPLLVMEYVEGRTLRDILHDGPVSLGLAMRYAIQITDAVGFAHDRGIIHCDIKSSNVQISPSHVAKVLDFGLARVMLDPGDEVSASEAGKVMGTAGYMAPERLMRGTLNTACDIYAIGVVLFELLTNRPPYTELGADLMLAVLATDAPKPSSVVPGLPPQLDDIVTRALARNPELRYRSARELSRDLAEVLASIEGRPWSGQFPMTDQPAMTPTWKNRLLVGVAAAPATVVALTVAGFVTSSFYNYPLGREESALLWPRWGLSAMVAPIGTVFVYAVMPYVVLTVVCRITAAAIAPLRRSFELLKTWLRSVVHRAESVSSGVLAQAVIVIQLAALGWFAWRFSDLDDAIMNFVVRTASQTQITLFAPWNEPEHRAYRQILAIVLFVWVMLAWRLLKLRFKRGDSEGLGSIVGVLAITALTFFLLVAPFRILRQSDGERVRYADTPCHIVGQRGSDVLLFCPFEAPNWTRIVAPGDPLLKREQTFGNIFEELNRKR